MPFFDQQITDQGTLQPHINHGKNFKQQFFFLLKLVTRNCKIKFLA